MISEDMLETVSFDEIYSGRLAVRIARTKAEIESAQRLRYRVFYNEMGGVPSEEMRAIGRDFDGFDPYCDHLLVIDYDLPATESQVVGTYRLLRRSRMKDLKHFYTETEFNIAAFKDEEGEILELGRSCVDAKYRNRSVMQLLLRGIAAYVTQHDVKLMFGCASFFGTDIAKHALPLSYLYHYHLAPQEIRAKALPDQYVEMNLIPKEEIDVKKAFAGLPALIKGYLRISGYIGQGAVIDPHFNTIDVGIVVKTDLVSYKYAQRYSTPNAKN
ncbi:MAG TPA: GNAT family N-acyltransferase [Rickettsiales bacterium]|nr:GNAT family N-acyltransferase [Rickettsiales bacterium]